MEFEMKSFSLLIAAATIGAAGLAAAPAFAATTTTPTSVPFCNSGASHISDQKQELSDQLRLDTQPGSSIEVWNGCLKVMTTTASGHTSVAFYNPESLALVYTLNAA